MSDHVVAFCDLEGDETFASVRGGAVLPIGTVVVITDYTGTDRTVRDYVVRRVECQVTVGQRSTGAVTYMFVEQYGGDQPAARAAEEGE